MWLIESRKLDEEPAKWMSVQSNIWRAGTRRSFEQWLQRVPNGENCWKTIETSHKRERRSKAIQTNGGNRLNSTKSTMLIRSICAVWLGKKVNRVTVQGCVGNKQTNPTWHHMTRALNPRWSKNLKMNAYPIEGGTWRISRANRAH